jgi:8-oxo-dGTP pyrophosphatase MutT (NUDIX family)
MTPKQEQSFGIIPLRKTLGGWEVFLIQHAKSRYWGFPKGHSEEGESPSQAAIRELKEETNLDVVRYLQQEPLQEQYQFRVKGHQVFKKVLYYVAEVEGEVKLQMHEVQNGIWISFSDAIHQVTHAEGKSILTQVRAILSEF